MSDTKRTEAEAKADAHDHLWNDLPFEERRRLMPYQMQSQIRHLKGARSILVNGHKKALRELDGWINNIEKSLATVGTGKKEQEQ